jgi:hypothetical protein
MRNAFLAIRSELGTYFGLGKSNSERCRLGADGKDSRLQEIDGDERRWQLEWGRRNIED